jgi:hypothetical protein
MFGEQLVNAQPSGDHQWNEPKLATTHLLLSIDQVLMRWQQVLNLPRIDSTPGVHLTELPTPSPTFAGGGIGGSGGGFGGGLPWMRMHFSAGATGHVLQIGHSIFTLLFALAGGWLGKWLARCEGVSAGEIVKMD